MRPMTISHVGLVALLRDIAARVECGDSLEGSLEYGATANPDEWEIRASFRTDNRNGQGGVRLIGILEKQEAEAEAAPNEAPPVTVSFE